MNIIDGNFFASQIRSELKEKIQKVQGRRPGLAFILVGDHPTSTIYVRMKKKACKEVGIHSCLLNLPQGVEEKEIIQEIQVLNQDPHIDGILLQLPLPKHIHTQKVLQAIDVKKDVDGFHKENMGALLLGQKDGFVPCTPKGIHRLLELCHVKILGKNVVIIGRSNIVGKPLAALLMQKQASCNATVTLVHSHTKNIKEHCQRADILIAATGNPLFVKADMVQKNAIVIDVGINRIEDHKTPKGYRLVGDVDFQSVQKKASLISPVPGGVGPMTIAMLLENTWISFSHKMDVKT